MKYIRSLLAVAVLAISAYTSQAVTPSAALGPIIFKITALSTGPDMSSGKTNITSTSTNITSTEKVTAVKKNFNGATLLKMLANSLNTTFPTDATIQFDNDLNIVVAVGSNTVQTVTNVLALQTTNSEVVTGSISSTEKNSSAGFSEKETQKLSITEAASLDYDDSALVTADGSTTRFSLKGIMVEHGNVSTSTTTEKITATLSFTGGGGGSIIHGSTTDIVVQGGFVSKVSETLATP